MNLNEAVALRKELEALVVDSPEFKELERRRLGFCPFEALGMVNAEIRHSNFLASMMDPHRPHGLGTAVLREVLDGIVAEVGDVAGISRLQLHLLDLDDADIRREWSRIDLLVAFPKARLVVVFELKIGAGESEGQLSTYRTAVERNWPSTGKVRWRHQFLFLTRDGKKPTDKAWWPVTYNVIIDAISRVLERNAGGEPMARAMLEAYARMLRKHHMDDRELAELARSLWARHGQALDYLMRQRPDGLVSLGTVVVERQKAICELASLPTLHLEPEESTKTWVRFYIREWEALNEGATSTTWIGSGRMLIVELQFLPRGVKAVLILGPGPSELRERYFDLAKPGMARVQGKLPASLKTLDGVWLLSEDDVDEDPEAAIAKMVDNLKRFLAGPITTFDRLFQPVLASPSRAGA